MRHPQVSRGEAPPLVCVRRHCQQERLGGILRLSTWLEGGEPTRCSHLLDRASDRRKYVVGVGTDQPDRTHHDHQNNRQHHGIFGNILPLIVLPEIT
jgi:hypothetical protein